MSDQYFQLRQTGPGARGRLPAHLQFARSERYLHCQEYKRLPQAGASYFEWTTRWHARVLLNQRLVFSSFFCGSPWCAAPKLTRFTLTQFRHSYIPIELAAADCRLEYYLIGELTKE